MRSFARVDWIDSFSPFQDDAWRNLDELIESIEVGLPRITTVGQIIFEDDDLIALAASMHDDRACGVMVIPKVCIVEQDDWLVDTDD